jgi:hypothetical protein
LNNKLSCVSGNSKENQGGYRAQETRIVDQRTHCSSFARQCLTSQCCHKPWISWTPGAGKFFHIHHTVLIWHHQTSIYSQRWESTSEVSASTPMMFKMKLRNGYVPRTHFVYMKDMTNWYIAMISVQTDLLTM